MDAAPARTGQRPEAVVDPSLFFKIMNSKVEEKLLWSQIRESGFTKDLGKKSHMEVQTTDEVLRAFANFLRGFIPYPDDGFEYIRFGSEFENKSFMEASTLNCKSLRIPAGCDESVALRVICTFIEIVPLRDYNGYKPLFDEIDRWIPAQPGRARVESEITERIRNILGEKAEHEYSISPVPIFAQELVVGVLEFMPRSGKKVAVFLNNGWQETKLLGPNLLADEISGKFHIVYNEYALLYDEDSKKITRRSLHTREITVVLKDVDYFRSHFGKCFAIAKNTAMTWSHDRGSFIELFTNEENPPVSVTHAGWSQKIRIRCRQGEFLCSKEGGRIEGWCPDPKHTEMTENLTIYPEGHAVVDGYKKLLGDSWTHAGCVPLTCSDEKNGIYETTSLRRSVKAFHGPVVAVGDVLIGYRPH